MVVASSTNSRPVQWQVLIPLILGFWLSGSLVLDLVVMPGLYAAGMTAEPQFAAAGYILFGLFNRVELLCAALIASGIWGLQTIAGQNQQRTWVAVLPLVLLGIVLIDTYYLTPQMGALGLGLNLFQPEANFPAQMNLLHGGYWLLEVIKLAIAAVLLRISYQRRDSL